MRVATRSRTRVQFAAKECQPMEGPSDTFGAQCTDKQTEMKTRDKRLKSQLVKQSQHQKGAAGINKKAPGGGS
jgi:hypothetical protein